MFVYLQLHGEGDHKFYLKGKTDVERADKAVEFADHYNSEGLILDENGKIVAGVVSTPGAMNGFTVRVFK